MTGDVHRGEDLAQETFSRMFSAAEGIRVFRPLSTFLWRVALNICYDELRKVKRRRESGSAWKWNRTARKNRCPKRRVQICRSSEQERAEAVRKALVRLAETYRVVVVLRHYEGLKFREIGEVLEIPEGTVKSRMAEALSQLNQILSQTLNEEEISCKQDQTTAGSPVI